MARHVAANALTLIIVALVALVAIIAWGQSQFRGPGPLTEPRVFEVERGETLTSVAQRLKSEGAVTSDTIFRIGARYADLDALRFGEYELPARASMEDVLKILNSGVGIVRRVIVPEGLTSWQVVELLRAREDLSGEITEVPAEGSLAPAAYDYRRDEDRNAVLARMAAEQDRLLAEAWAARAPDLPVRTPAELLILASIVEKETGVPEERGRVAGVFVNRLKRGMRLQTDPTVIYGITRGEGTLGRGLTRTDLTTATLWNTYVIDGLPPTPIANPGRESLMAAAQPEATDYIYFVADGTGGHAFARTLEEHNRNVAEWRRIEAERAAEAAEAAAAAAAEPAAAGAPEGTGQDAPAN